MNFKIKSALFSARFFGLWNDYKMPKIMRKSSFLRLRGAYLGWNSLDYAMENRPVAHWGNTITHFNIIIKKNIYKISLMENQTKTMHFTLILITNYVQHNVRHMTDIFFS